MLRSDGSQSILDRPTASDPLERRKLEADDALEIAEHTEV